MPTRLVRVGSTNAPIHRAERKEVAMSEDSNEASVQSDVRLHEGRVPCGKDCSQDASRWITHLAWTDASELGPVYGYLVLIADRSGYVNVLDLRRPEGEDPGSVTDEEQWKRTKEALARNNAKWWAYLPVSPPVNVDAVPWGWSEERKPIPVDANDPPKAEWKWARNLPHKIVK